MSNQLIITKPSYDEYPEWYAAEIGLVHYNDLITGLQDSISTTLTFLNQITDSDLEYRYAPGKWSIKQIWQHIIDVERVLSYRALRYARKDETVLTAFDENKYAAASNADYRQFSEIIREYAVVRDATMELFRSFTEAMFLHRGTAGKSNMTVRSVGFLILGHEIHHVQTIKERYLKRK
ncbi:MAG: DinB family protein [Panacibacter sp.]